MPPRNAVMGGAASVGRGTGARPDAWPQCGRAFVLAALVTFTLPPAARAQQFSVQPALLTLSAAAGGEQVLTVSNQGSTPLELRLYAGGFDIRETGDVAFSPADSTDADCGARLSIFPEALVIGPGEARQARVGLAAGEGSCWSAVFVEGRVPSSGPLRVNQRIAVLLFGVGASAAPAGAVEAVSATSVDDSVSVSVRFANRGRSPIWPSGTVEIRDVSGQVVATAPVPPFAVLPEHARSMRVSFDEDLEPGRYVVVGILDYGGPVLSAGQSILTVR